MLFDAQGSCIVRLCALALVFGFTRTLPGADLPTRYDWNFDTTQTTQEWSPYLAGRSEVVARRDESVGRTGKGSLFLEVPDSAPIDFYKWSIPVPKSTPGDLWRLSTFIKTLGVHDESGAGVYLAINLIDGTGNRISWEQSTGIMGTTEGWKYLPTQVWLDDKCKSIRIELILHGRGKVWFDDVRFERLIKGPENPESKECRVKLDSAKVVNTLDFGFGFEDDPFFYTSENVSRGVTEVDFKLREERVRQLKPDFVRCFIWWNAFNPAHDYKTIDLGNTYGQSLLRTLRFYKDLGVPVLLCDTQWGFNGDAFPYSPTHASQGAHLYAEIIHRLVRDHGFDNIRWVTLCNEPDLAWVGGGGTIETYRTAYRTLGQELKDRKLDDKIKILGGDVTSNHYFLNTCMESYGDLTNQWSIHSYVRLGSVYLNEILMRQDLETVKGGKLILAEFGFNLPGENDLNHPSVRMFEYGIDAADTCIRAMNVGLQGASIWCLCSQIYPGGMKMDLGLWEYKDQDFKPRPLCFAYGMFTKYLEAGDRVGSFNVEGNGLISGSVIARAGKSAVVYLLNRADHPVRADLEGATLGQYDRFLYSSAPLKIQDAILLAPEGRMGVASDGKAAVDLPANSFTTLLWQATNNKAGVGP